MSATPSPESASFRNGLYAGIGAFAIWGVLPLYLLPLHATEPLTVITHRLIWCCVFVLLWLALRGGLGTVLTTLRRPGIVLRLGASAALISLNWLLYVWAIANGHVVDTSLGYFINPLVNVLFGVVLLSERLNSRQWTAVAVAATGVLWLTWLAGQLPWIALALAVSFGAYGLVRKTTKVDSVTGLAVETLLLAPFGLAWLLWLKFSGAGFAEGQGPLIGLWLVFGGVVTAVPLAMFAFAAQKLPYSMVGVLQYLAPTLQLLCGLFIFHEVFPPERAVGFALIWTALAIYVGDGLLRMRRTTVPVPSV